MSIHCFRLHRGDDLRRSLEEYARTHAIDAAVVLSAVGCLSRAVIRDASGVTIHTLEEARARVDQLVEEARAAVRGSRLEDEFLLELAQMLAGRQY